MAVNWLSLLSQVLGWLYFFAWSLSFYPQALLNYRRRSTSGSTIDFPLINVVGFLAYFTYTVTFYASPLIRAQYAQRNHGLYPTVQANDVAFASHALLISAVVLSQYFPQIWGFDKRGKRGPGAKLSLPILGLAVVCSLWVGAVVLLVSLSPAKDNIAESWAWIDVIYAISYVKLVITVVKYIPQVITNYRNQSTHGWAIWMILLDFTGGILSITQLGIDSYLQRDWSGITGNSIKLLLGNISMFFDVIFMAQHYIIYAGNNAARKNQGKDSDDEEPLLGDDIEGNRRARLD